MPRTISRNPFARTDTVRTVAYRKGATVRGCDWCGASNADRALYTYRTEEDRSTSRTTTPRHVFCSVGCCRNYES
jgi:hypothetical protein